MSSSLMLASLQQGDTGAMIGPLIALAIAVAVMVAAWKVYTKAGRPGWAIFVPFYNAYVLLKIVGRPGWWLLLLFIPLVNFVIGLIVYIDLAKSFGKGTVFGLGLFFLYPIFVPILGFGDAEYVGPAAAS